jgi:HD-GYP domain-containing protein (c-di-GMP phosphodiesterase class II)
MKIAKAFELSEAEIEKYKTACMLHDIGKITIDPEILDKTEKLSQEEWEMIKRHPETGYRILNAVPDFSEIAEYVLAHHERWDGNGYPKGLKVEEIPYISRIIAICDSYDAMTGLRTYGRVRTKEEALSEIKSCAGTHFAPALAASFIDMMKSNIELLLL